MSPEEVDEEIADIVRGFEAERKALRTEALDTFLKTVPKSW